MLEALDGLVVGGIRGRLGDLRGRRQGGFVSLADAQEGEGELCVGRDALEKRIAELEIFLPVGNSPGRGVS